MRRHTITATIAAALVAGAMHGCDVGQAGPRAYPSGPGAPARPHAIAAEVATSPVRWMPQLERVRVRVVRLHPVARGRLEPGSPFPIIVERIAPDGLTASFSTEHAFDFYDAPYQFFAAGDGAVWFQPSAASHNPYGPDDSRVFGGDQLAVTGDGSVWLSNGATLAHIAPGGKATFYRAPGTTIAKLVGGSGRSILALDGATHDVYRIDGDRSTWLVGTFPKIPLLGYLAHEGRDALWFGDDTKVSVIAGDGSEMRTLEVRLPHAQPLCGDGKALWVNTRLARPSHDAILSRYAVDGTVSRFRIAYSLPFAANLGPDGRLLLEAAIPGRDFEKREFFEIGATGRGTRTQVSSSTRVARGNGIALLPDGAFIAGWDQRSFATIAPRGGVETTEIPRP